MAKKRTFVAVAANQLGGLETLKEGDYVRTNATCTAVYTPFSADNCTDEPLNHLDTKALKEFENYSGPVLYAGHVVRTGEASGRSYAFIKVEKAWDAQGNEMSSDVTEVKLPVRFDQVAELNKVDCLWAEVKQPRPKAAEIVTLDSVVLDEHKKEEIREAIGQIANNDLIFEDWGFGEVFEKGTAVSMLFYGPPGCGKTLVAQALANTLGLTLKIVQTAEVQSSEPGGAERALKEFFEKAVENKELLLFDECDSLIGPRADVGMILAGQINALLSALELYTGVVIFTTNRLCEMDPAFERRVAAKIEFPFPTEAERAAIWRVLMPEDAPLADDVDFNEYAKAKIAGGNIKNVILNAARRAAYRKLPAIDKETLDWALAREKESMKRFYDEIGSRYRRPRPVGLGMTASGSLQIQQGGGDYEYAEQPRRQQSLKEEMRDIVTDYILMNGEKGKVH